MLQLLRYAFAYTFGVLGFLVVVAGPQLLPGILTKDWMGSVQKWIIIDFLNSHRFVRSCHFQKICVLPESAWYSSSVSFMDLLSQSYCFRSTRILFSQCPFWKQLLDCFTCIDLQSLGMSATVIHLFQTTQDLEFDWLRCAWYHPPLKESWSREGCSCLLLKVTVESSNYFSLSWILTIQMQLNLETASSIVKTILLVGRVWPCCGNTSL